MKIVEWQTYHWKIFLIALVTVFFVTFISIYSSVTRRIQPVFLTSPVIRSGIEETVLAAGTLQPLKLIDVGAQVSGQVKSLNVDLGDSVVKGQLLAEIDPILSQNALRQAKINTENLIAQRESAMANLRQLQITYERYQKLLLGNAISRQEVDTNTALLKARQADISALDAQIRAANIQIDTAKENLNYTRIIAPIGGTVIAILTQQGQTVIAQQEVPVLLKLADMSIMTVMTRVSEADIIHIHPGQIAYFNILGDTKHRYYGKLRAIEPSPSSFISSQRASESADNNEKPVFYNALFDVPNAKRLLRISMTAQVHIVITSEPNALTIPLAAVVSKDNDSAIVRILQNNKDELRTIKTGISDNVRIQVISGLDENDKVIIGEKFTVDSKSTNEKVLL
ncbi:macrolide transporter subunit MacA [Kosakonia oryzae]|uniref:macrolide transporter subunit MacA n=1 Tax=Kosakonia oryzae TaxID=497725 RepID=UPI001D077854|nr:macrolide transporter subunit MacA [Kosakonia oryzae]UDJ82068.1 macrolide transporter subunit MacA [Kosakonia oryzae]